jgi:hypothetical protein
MIQEYFNRRTKPMLEIYLDLVQSEINKKFKELFEEKFPRKIIYTFFKDHSDVTVLIYLIKITRSL